MKKLISFILALGLAGSALASNTTVLMDTVTRALTTGGFKVPSAQTVEFQSGSTLQVDTGATFTFQTGSIPWTAITGTPTTLSGYGISNGQVLNANLTAISGLTSAANTLPYFTGSGTAALANFSAFGISLVASSNVAAAQSVLTLVPGTNVQAFSATLSNVAAGTYAGATSINTLGSVTTGSWNATPISLTAFVAGILPGANGGTNNAFFQVSGPATSLKTYTLPNASANILTDNAAVTPAQGGDGVNNGAFTETRAGNITFAGAFTQAFTATANTAVTLPITGTLATLAGTEVLTNKTLNGLALAAQTTGFSIAGGTTPKTLTIPATMTITAGSDGLTLNLGPGGTLGTAAFTNTGAYEVPLTFSTGLTRTTNTITVNTSQNIATLSNLTTNGFVTTTGGNGTLTVIGSTGSGINVLQTGPTITGENTSGIVNLGVRDTSAAFDVTIGATSSVTLTAGRALTLDVTNGARTIKLTGNTVLNQDVSTAGSPTFVTPTVTSLLLGATTPGTIAGASGAISLTAAGTNQAITLAASGTGGVVVNAGTAVNPSIEFSSDTSTGLYHPSASQIGFSIAGLGVGNVTSTGLNSMAVGATTPSTGAFTTATTSGLATLNTLATTGLGTLNSLAVTTTSTLTGNVAVGSSVSLAYKLAVLGSPPSSQGAGGADFIANTTFNTYGNGQTYRGIQIAANMANGAFTSPAWEGIYIGTPVVTGTALSSGFMIDLQAPAAGMSGSLNITSGAVNLGSGATTVGSLSTTGSATATQFMTGASTASAPAGSIQYNSGNGLHIVGNTGSTYDVRISNGSGAVAAFVPTGTQSWGVQNNLTVGGTSTLTGNVGIGAASAAGSGLSVKSPLTATGSAAIQTTATFTPTGTNSFFGGIVIADFLAMGANTGTQYSAINLQAPTINSGAIGGGWMITMAAPALGMAGSLNITSGAVNLGSGVVNGSNTYTNSLSQNSQFVSFYSNNANVGASAITANRVGNGTTSLYSAITGTGNASGILTNGLTGVVNAAIYTDTAVGISIGTNALAALNIDGTQHSSFKGALYQFLPAVITYAATVSLDPTTGNVFEFSTINGALTINLATVPTAGQHFTIILPNDAVSGRTVTFGTSFRAVGTLVGTTSKAATITFVSDGTSAFEVSRALVL
jgi:hypothetical protein